MTELALPEDLIEGRRTPLFDASSLPGPLATSHRTTVWAELRVVTGSVRYVDLDGTAPRDIRLDPGDNAVIAPGIGHVIEPSTDATFWLQFFRRSDAPLVPGVDAPTADDRGGPWQHRGVDLDTPDEIFEMVTRQYVDVVQDELLQPYFTFGPGYVDWQAHIGLVADYWCHVLLYAPGYEIDTIANHRRFHEQRAFTPSAFDRWLQVFDDTVDGGWSGPNATAAKKHAIGVAWAMAKRTLGPGVWDPHHRDG